MSALVHAGIPHPPGADTPQEQTPQSRHPPRADMPPEQPPPESRHPRRRHPTPQEQNPLPPEQTHRPRSRHPPGSRHVPPMEADSGIRSMSGRYASYWNAFLFILNLFCRYGFLYSILLKIDSLLGKSQ